MLAKIIEIRHQCSLIIIIHCFYFGSLKLFLKNGRPVLWRKTLNISPYLTIHAEETQWDQPFLIIVINWKVCIKQIQTVRKFSKFFLASLDLAHSWVTFHCIQACTILHLSAQYIVNSFLHFQDFPFSVKMTASWSSFYIKPPHSGHYRWISTSRLYSLYSVITAEFQAF